MVYPRVDYAGCHPLQGLPPPHHHHLHSRVPTAEIAFPPPQRARVLCSKQHEPYGSSDRLKGNHEPCVRVLHTRDTTPQPYGAADEPFHVRPRGEAAWPHGLCCAQRRHAAAALEPESIELYSLGQVEVRTTKKTTTMSWMISRSYRLLRRPRLGTQSLFESQEDPHRGSREWSRISSSTSAVSRGVCPAGELLCHGEHHRHAHFGGCGHAHRVDVRGCLHGRTCRPDWAMTCPIVGHPPRGCYRVCSRAYQARLAVKRL